MNKKLIAGVLCGVVAGAAGVGLHDVLEQPDVEQVIKEVQVNNTVEVPVEVVRNVTVEKIVEVDNGNLDLVLDEIYDNDGSVEYLIDDLDDDELDQIVSRIVFANDVKALAIEAVKDEGISLLDDELVNGTEIDDRDVERFKVQSDDDEVVIESIDYDDSDADVTVEAKFEQDDVKYLAVYDVRVKDGKVEDVDLVSVSLR